MQPTVKDLVGLAAICARRSRLVESESESTANERWRLAEEYQLDHDALPDIGTPCPR
jgi:hypothetical protein